MKTLPFRYEVMDGKGEIQTTGSLGDVMKESAQLAVSYTRSIAKKYNILIVPGSTFMCPGYVRIAYCVSYETVVNSLPKFALLAKEFF